MKRTAATTVLLLLLCLNVSAEGFKPTGTYIYAHRDTCDLYLDHYAPAPGSVAQGGTRPAILFSFGGGFKEGSRDSGSYMPWFKALTEAGFTVVSIDYRLGLKDFNGAGVNPKFIGALGNAIDIAVEDLFSATAFIVENAGMLGIDPSRIVASGSSAGAITVLQAEWEICNSGSLAGILPDGFNYAGVISFSGAVFSRSGAVRFPVKPCPMMMLHGTADKIVPYKQIAFLNLHFSGTDVITRWMKKDGWCYNCLRFDGHSHEIAVAFMPNLAEELRFLQTNVIEGKDRTVDVLIDDPDILIPSWAKGSYKKLY